MQIMSYKYLFALHEKSAGNKGREFPRCFKDVGTQPSATLKSVTFDYLTPLGSFENLIF